MRYPSFASFLVFIVVGTLPFVANAQNVIDEYVAIIGEQDRINSRGVALTRPDQILAQDRANYHRFGRRDPGDASDNFFSARENRASLPNLLDNGHLAPDARQAIISGMNVRLRVEIRGDNGRPQSIYVTLDDQPVRQSSVETEPAIATLQVANTISDQKKITVRFSDPEPGPKPWITIVQAGSPGSAIGEYHLTNGRTAGQATFEALPAGSYEVRLHRDLASASPVSVATIVVTTTDQQAANDPDEWYARTECSTNRGKVEIEMEFSVSSDSNATSGVAHRANMIVTASPSVSSGTSVISFIGEQDRAGGDHITFARESVRRDSSLGIREIDIERFNFTEDSRRGSFPNTDCEPFTADAKSNNQLRYLPSVPSPDSGGTFWASTSVRDRCEAIIAWVGRLVEENPGRDFFRSNRQGDEWRKVRLFADDDFVPVFGEPYDTMPHNVRSSIEKELRSCVLNPFIGDRMETYEAAARRILRDNPDSQIYHGGFYNTAFAIRRIREARNTIKELLSLGENEIRLLGFDGSLDLVQQAKTILEDRKDYFWPSEISDLNDNIAGKSQKIGLIAANVARSSIDEATSDHQRIQLAGALLSDNAIRSTLGSEVWGELERDLNQIISESSDRLIEPLLASVSGQPNSLAGAISIKELVADKLPDYSVVPPKLMDGYQEEIDSALRTRLIAAVDRELSMLKTFSPTRTGLQEMSTWFEEFQSEFAEFEGYEAVKAALRMYRESRESLLETALEEFLTNLEGTASTEERVNLMRQYLNEDNDFSYPVALEYQLFAQ